MTSATSGKDITIICVSYKRYREIHVLINSFLCQTRQNWELVIIHDGRDAQMRGEVDTYTKWYDNIKYMETDKRYNDYGHSLRELGINIAKTPYLMMTNDDNYYVPKYLEVMFSVINTHNLDFAFCDMVSSHMFRFKKKPPDDIYTKLIQTPEGHYIQPQYNVIRSVPKKHCIDIGSFIVKSELARAVGFSDKGFYGDGTFVEELMSQNQGKIRVGKVNQVLFVHN